MKTYTTHCRVALSRLLVTALAVTSALLRADINDDTGEPVQLAKIEVIETRATSPIDSTALKLPISLHETPRSVTVFDASRIEEQNFQKLEDTFRYVPGVFTRSQDGDSYHFLSRGFDMGPDETKLDGFSGLLAGGTFSPSLFGIEQVVYLRGPAGLLYGAAATPGGVINLVTKKPAAARFASVEARNATYAGGGLSLGSHSTAEFNFDFNTPLRADGRLLARVTGEIENRGSFKDGIDDHERALLAAFTWKFGRDDRFALTPRFQYQRQPFGAGRAVLISPSTSLSTNDGRTGPITAADLSPLHLNFSSGERTLTHHIAGLDLTAALSSQWRITAAYRFLRADSDAAQFTVQTATLRQLDRNDPRSWVVSRRFSQSETDRRNHAFELSATGETLPAAGVKNLTQFGFNGRFFQTTAARSTATQPDQSPINIYTGVPVSAPASSRPALTDTFLNDDFYWNTYLQNQTSFRDRWILTLGAGYGEQRFGRDYPAGLTPPANLAQLTATRRGEVTPNAALVFHATRRLALYTSYSTSYSPADGSYEDSNGDTGGFGPTTGTNLETGAKLDLPRQRASLTLSVFQTELDNVLNQSDSTQLNPHGNRYYTQTGGGRRTRGTEFSAEASPVAGWRVNATASYLDSRYRGEGRLVGSRTERTPPWAFSLYQRYDFQTHALRGLGLTLGVIWQDARWSAARTAAAPDPLLLPSYTRIDAGLFYRFADRWDFALNCENALDQTYFVNGTTGAALEVGAPRSLAFRLSRHW